MKQIIKHIHCPVNGWDCPYYTDENHPCRCLLKNPMKNCDDFATMWEEGDDYIDDDWEIDSEAELEKLMIENADVLKEMRQRFDEVMIQRDSKYCETCPIYKECQEMPDRYDEKPLYDCDDLMFAYLLKGKNFKEILKKDLTN